MEKLKKFIGTRKYIHKKYKTLLIHENTYTTIIAANPRIHDTRNIDTRVKTHSMSIRFESESKANENERRRMHEITHYTST